MIVIDGSMGEGGGQVLRTTLALSLVTGSPVRIVGIRRNRLRPGLRPQHLTAVAAAQEISSAEVDGAEIGSAKLTFAPQRLRSGTYSFAIGTAGSTTLVAQTLIPALMLAEGPSHLTLEGGTHNPMSPSFESFARAYLPMLRAMRVRARATLQRAGYFPAGGGRIHVDITPPAVPMPLHIDVRGQLRRGQAEAVVAHLPLRIARRELDVVARSLGWVDADLQARSDSASLGPGNVLTITLTFDHLTEVFAGFGQRGIPAETVAQRTVDEVTSYLDSGGAVGPYLADQLLLPMALLGGGRFTTVAPTAHTLTNAQVIERFLDTSISADKRDDGMWVVKVAARCA